MNKFAVDSEQVFQQFMRARERIDKDTPILCFSDVFRTGVLDGEFDSTRLCQRYINLITKVFADCTLLIPSFNYDFCKNGIYDVARSLGQVGLISKHIIRDHYDLRTLTPVFNFIVFNNACISTLPQVNPFDDSSAFGELHANDGVIVFLGTACSVNTFIHYVEHKLDVPYRYIKRFDGTIVTPENQKAASLDFRVRPPVDGLVEYTDLGEKDLEKEGVLHRYPLGLSEVVTVRAQDYYNVISRNLRRDPFCMLSDTSRVKAEFVCNQLHGRIRLEDENNLDTLLQDFNRELS